MKERPLSPTRCLPLLGLPLTVSFTVGSQAARQAGRKTDRLSRLRREPVAVLTAHSDNRQLAMISPDFNFNILTRDLSHYLENQVKVGLFGSGVGLSLVLGFSAAYTCYYLISVAKVRRFSSRNQHWIRLLFPSRDANFTKETSPIGCHQSHCQSVGIVADVGFRSFCIFPAVNLCAGTCAAGRGYPALKTATFTTILQAKRASFFVKRIMSCAQRCCSDSQNACIAAATAG